MKTFLLLPAFLLSMFVLFGCGDSDADFELMKREMIASRIQLADKLPEFLKILTGWEELLTKATPLGDAEQISQINEEIAEAQSWVDFTEKLRDESAEVRNLVASVEVYLLYKSLPSGNLRKEFRNMAKDPDIHSGNGKNRQTIIIQRYPGIADAITQNDELEKNTAALAERLNLKNVLGQLDYDSVEKLRHAYDELRKLE